MGTIFEYLLCLDILQTLFIKNLSQKATPENLVSLFIRFQKPDLPKVVFKLMSGRMKGQAFVTFDSKYASDNSIQLNSIRLVDKAHLSCVLSQKLSRK